MVTVQKIYEDTVEIVKCAVGSSAEDDLRNNVDSLIKDVYYALKEICDYPNTRKETDTSKLDF